MKRYLLSLLFITVSLSCFSQLSSVKMSQVYGGGGGGSTYLYDYVELHNNGTSPAVLTGTSLQYGAAAGNFGNSATAIYAFPAGTTIPPGGYLLIQLGSSGGSGTALPTAPDLTSSNLSMAATSGKVAFANQTTGLGCGATGSLCTLPNAAIIDLVSYGASNNGEGGTRVNNGTALTSAQGAIRKGNGCTDTDDNNADFDVVTAPVPRNSMSPQFFCGGGGGSPTLGASNVTNLSTAQGTPSNPGTSTITGSNLTPANAVITVTASSANIEVANNAGGPFGSSTTFTASSGSLAAGTQAYVRISAAAPLGPVNESITVSGGGVSPAVTATVSGIVVGSEPTAQATNITFANVTNTSFDINWTNGNGSARIVVVRAGTSAVVAPTDGVSYTSNAAFGTAGTSTGTGSFVVFDGGSGPVTVTNLTAGTLYQVQVFEYNGTGTAINYNTASAAGNPTTQLSAGLGGNTLPGYFTALAAGLYAPVTTNAGSPIPARVPVMCYATVSGLVPNTTYKYYTTAGNSSDLYNATSGAGLPISIDYTATTPEYTHSSTGNFGTPGSFGKFTTDANGKFSGSFGFVTSGNARFSAGTQHFHLLTLQKDLAPADGTFRLALNQSVTLIDFGTAAAQGTFIQGQSSATAGNLVGLWKSPDGQSFVAATARPLAVTLSETVPFTIGGPPTWGSNFATGYSFANGAWNTIIPNNNADGVKLIQQINAVSGAIAGCAADADGLWPSGAITVNPAGGLATPIQITATDAPLNISAGCASILAVNLQRFTATAEESRVRLLWSTASESALNHFEVLRSANGNDFKLIGTTAAKGNSSLQVDYASSDLAPLEGVNYYQLRSVNADGSFKYSEIRKVIFNGKIAVYISPNPVRDQVTIRFRNEGNKVADIQLLNDAGARVALARTSNNNVTMNASALAGGIYLVRVIVNGEVLTGRFVKQ